MLALSMHGPRRIESRRIESRRSRQTSFEDFWNKLRVLSSYKLIKVPRALIVTTLYPIQGSKKQTGGKYMSKAAITILATGDTPESLGRVVNALMAALEYKESGEEVRILFDGAGVQAAAAFAKSDHKYHDLYERVRDKVHGVCQYCAGAYEVKDRIQEYNLPLVDEFKQHPSFKSLVDEGFTILIF